LKDSHDNHDSHVIKQKNENKLENQSKVVKRENALIISLAVMRREVQVRREE